MIDEGLWFGSGLWVEGLNGVGRDGGGGQLGGTGGLQDPLFWNMFDCSKE